MNWVTVRLGCEQRQSRSASAGSSRSGEGKQPASRVHSGSGEGSVAFISDSMFSSSSKELLDRTDADEDKLVKVW